MFSHSSSVLCYHMLSNKALLTLEIRIVEFPQSLHSRSCFELSLLEILYRHWEDI